MTATQKRQEGNKGKPKNSRKRSRRGSVDWRKLQTYEAKVYRVDGMLKENKIHARSAEEASRIVFGLMKTETYVKKHEFGVSDCKFIVDVRELRFHERVGGER